MQWLTKDCGAILGLGISTLFVLGIVAGFVRGAVLDARYGQTLFFEGREVRVQVLPDKQVKILRPPLSATTIYEEGGRLRSLTVLPSWRTPVLLRKQTTQEEAWLWNNFFAYH